MAFEYLIGPVRYPQPVFQEYFSSILSSVWRELLRIVCSCNSSSFLLICRCDVLRYDNVILIFALLFSVVAHTQYKSFLLSFMDLFKGKPGYSVRGGAPFISMTCCSVARTVRLARYKMIRIFSIASSLCGP